MTSQERLTDLRATTRPDVTFGDDYAIRGADAKWLLDVAEAATKVDALWPSILAAHGEGRLNYEQAYALCELRDALTGNID